MWTDESRKRHDRSKLGLRYPSDLTDEEYALIEPHLLPSRKHSTRNLLDGVLYVLTTGCQWDQLPKDFPPKSTTHDYFVKLHAWGILKTIHHLLYASVREQMGKAAEPTLAIVDSQSVESAEKGGHTLIQLSGMMQARKSKARNVMLPSTRSGC